jgi:[ribosomal protein S5]-alanine N-acetyltransferase
MEEILKAKISSEHYLLETLSPAHHDLTNYLSWMRNKNSNFYIQTVSENYSEEDLVRYIKDKNNSSNALLLGIFTKSDFLHIGNIKLEPIMTKKSATLGILVGEESWRGKGVGFEVITRVLEYGFNDLELELVELGVSKKNLKAIDLYLRLGFLENTHESSSTDSIRMSISKSSLN